MDAIWTDGSMTIYEAETDTQRMVRLADAPRICLTAGQLLTLDRAAKGKKVPMGRIARTFHNLTHKGHKAS